MRLVSMQFVTLDGVYQGPGSPEEDTTGGFERGGWMPPHLDKSFLEKVAAWAESAEALLLGRRTYEEFAQAWPGNDDPGDPFAEKMNAMPKYVVSNTLEEANWKPVTILDGDVLAKVSALKAQPGGELQVHGSGRLAASLLAAGLVDELRLVIAPTILGQGRRLYDDGPALGMRVTDHALTPGGLTILVLETTGPAAFASYEGAGSVNS